MTTLETNIKTFNNLITNGETLKAMELFYAQNVVMQENEDLPRIGKQLCIEHEKLSLSRVKNLEIKIISQAIDLVNEVVFSEYEMAFITLKDKKMLLKEVSVQCWQNDLMIQEKFYYKEIAFVN